MNLNEIFKFMNNRENRVLIWIILVAIIFFGLPGNVLIFAWNKELYLKMDIIKLLMLSFGIPMMSIIFVAIATSIALWIVNYKLNYKNMMSTYIGLAIIVNDIIIIFATMQKVIEEKFTAGKCIAIIIIPIALVIVIGGVYVHNKLKKLNGKHKD